MQEILLKFMHFIIYAVLLTIKFTKMYAQKVKSTLRHSALMMYYGFDENQAIRECCSLERMNMTGGPDGKGTAKKLSHVAIVVNDLAPNSSVNNSEVDLSILRNVSRIINYLALSVDGKIQSITVYDKVGHLKHNMIHIKTQLTNALGEDVQMTC